MSYRRLLEFFVWAKHIALLHAPLATETGSYVANKRIYNMAPSRNCQPHKEIFPLPYSLTIHVWNSIVLFLILVLELLAFFSYDLREKISLMK